MLQEWASSKNKDAPQRYSIMLNKLLTWLCYQRIDFAPSPFIGWSLLTDDENGRGQPVTCLNCIDWIVPIGDVGARSSSTATCAVSLAEQILHQSLYSCIPSNSHIRVFSCNFIKNVSWTLCHLQIMSSWAILGLLKWKFGVNSWLFSTRSFLMIAT